MYYSKTNFNQYSENQKTAFEGGGLWSDRGYIGTVGDGTISDVVKNYVENQGNQEEKEAYKQMKVIDF
jgi:putative transposase